MQGRQRPTAHPLGSLLLHCLLLHFLLLHFILLLGILHQLHLRRRRLQFLNSWRISQIWSIHLNGCLQQSILCNITSRLMAHPWASRFHRLEGVRLKKLGWSLNRCRSTSPWASPLHMMAKKDGTWRHFGNFRRLNLVTKPDGYLLPNMLDFAERLSKCTVF